MSSGTKAVNGRTSVKRAEKDDAGICDFSHMSNTKKF